MDLHGDASEYVLEFQHIVEEVQTHVQVRTLRSALPRLADGRACRSHAVHYMYVRKQCGVGSPGASVHCAWFV